MFARKAREAGFRSVAQDLASIEWNVGLIELNARVESSDFDHLVHAGCLELKFASVFVVIVGLPERIS
jgi:hypothetical protein